LRILRAHDHAPATVSGAHSLRLDRLSKSYGPVRAVDDVSLDIPRGEFLTLLGPSGSGKTTLLMMIAGFTQPSAGEIVVYGRSVTAVPPERRNFGMVFQGYALFPHMTVQQNVAYPLRVRGMARETAAARVRAALAQVRLTGLEQRRPRELSGGQQQRVAIARALVFGPDILLLDEPLGALDRQLRAEVQMELKALHADLGTTFVYVTHDQDEALSMSDRVAIVNGGRLEQVDTPQALYERPATRFAAQFLGRSNCFRARVLDCDGGATRLEAGGRTLLHRGQAQAAQALLAIRPEKVALSRTEPEAANRVPGRVAALAYLGATMQATVETEALGTMVATLLAWSAPPGMAQDDPVWLSWAADATVILRD
jgi:putative spermidine/putrescine transport system ATP-binding protein